jgi:hypothetical protein
MPLTTLDAMSALIVVDLQKGIVGAPVVHPLEAVIDRAAGLARAFRQNEMPVVLVNVTGGAPGRTDTIEPVQTPPPDWAELVSELDPQPEDLYVTKERWGAFHETSLHDELHARGVTQVVIVRGISRYAFSLGDDADSVARSARRYRGRTGVFSCGRRAGQPVRVSSRVRPRAVWCCVRFG